MEAEPSHPRVRRFSLSDLDPADQGLQLMYFGLKGMTREADDILARHGFSRAHHRILFVIARSDGITVGDLHASLGISAQAAHRPLKQLSDAGMIASSRDPARHRYRALHLTAIGRKLEHEASEAERAVMRAAFGRVGAQAAEAWERVMSAVAENA